LTPAQFKIERGKEQMNQRCCRNKPRNIHEYHNNKPSCSKRNTPYKSPAMLKKAVKWVATRHHKSPIKCHKVITELAIAHGIPVQSAPSNKQIHHLNPDTKEAFTEFHV
jgi:hypothetical protein